jgi:hypothetical protein
MMQKQNNKVISGIRIVSEHAIGGMKRMNSASQTFRNKSQKTNDSLGRCAAGLWNFHLQN